MRRWLGILVVVVIACILSTYLRSYHGIVNLAARGDEIVVLGDSISAGYGDGVGPERAYPTLLAHQLHLNLTNASLAGDTTGAALQRLQSDVLDQHPRLVIVELGGNDFLQHIPADIAADHLETIFRRIQAQGAMVMCLGVPTPFSYRYQVTFRWVCWRNGVYVVPNILRGVLGNPGKMVDYIHPNADGHQIIAEQLQPILEKLLRAADRARGQ